MKGQEGSPEKKERHFNKFEEEDGIEDEIERQADQRARERVRAEAEMDKQQTINIESMVKKAKK